METPLALPTQGKGCGDPGAPRGRPWDLALGPLSTQSSSSSSLGPAEGLGSAWAPPHLAAPGTHSWLPRRGVGCRRGCGVPGPAPRPHVVPGKDLMHPRHGVA